MKSVLGPLLVVVLLFGCGFGVTKDRVISLFDIERNDVVAVEAAIRSGAPPDRVWPDLPHKNSLAAAMSMGRIEIFRLLLRQGANPDSLVDPYLGETLLSKAISENKYEFVLALMRAGADMRTADGEGGGGALLQLLSDALEKNDAAMEGAILARIYARDVKVCPNIVGIRGAANLITLVMDNRRYDLVIPLLRAGVNPNSDDPGGSSPLYSALFIADAELKNNIIQELIAHGVRYDLADIRVRRIKYDSFEQYVKEKESPEIYALIFGNKRPEFRAGITRSCVVHLSPMVEE